MATLHGAGRRACDLQERRCRAALERCTNALDDRGELVPLDKAQAHEAVERMAAQGLRVLAFARRRRWHPITRGSSTATWPVA